MSIEADGKVKEFNVNAADTDTAVDTAQMVLAEVEDWAKSGAPPEGSLKTIYDLAKNLTDALNQTRNTTKIQVQASFDRITRCNKDQESSMEKLEKTKAEVGKQRDAHATCRNAEVGLHEKMKKKCHEFTTWLKDTVENSPPPEPSTSAEMADYVAKLSDDEMVDYVVKMSDYWCGKGKVAVKLQKECWNRTEAHRIKKEACDQHQTQFEDDFCEWRTQMIDVCTAQTTCYDAARTDCDAHVKSTQTDVDKWKIECTALEKIICYVNVWFDKDNHSTVAGGEDTDVDKDELEKCKRLEPDCSIMDIKFPDAPDKTPCSLADVKNHPGTPEFKKIEYSNWMEFVNEPTPCLEETSDPFGNPHKY